MRRIVGEVIGGLGAAFFVLAMTLLLTIGGWT